MSALPPKAASQFHDFRDETITAYIELTAGSTKPGWAWSVEQVSVGRTQGEVRSIAVQQCLLSGYLANMTGIRVVDIDFVVRAADSPLWPEMPEKIGGLKADSRPEGDSWSGMVHLSSGQFVLLWDAIGVGEKPEIRLNLKQDREDHRFFDVIFVRITKGLAIPADISAAVGAPLLTELKALRRELNNIKWYILIAIVGFAYSLHALFNR